MALQSALYPQVRIRAAAVQLPRPRPNCASHALDLRASSAEQHLSSGCNSCIVNERMHGHMQTDSLHSSLSVAMLYVNILIVLVSQPPKLRHFSFPLRHCITA